MPDGRVGHLSVAGEELVEGSWLPAESSISYSAGLVPAEPVEATAARILAQVKPSSADTAGPMDAAVTPSGPTVPLHVEAPAGGRAAADEAVAGAERPLDRARHELANVQRRAVELAAVRDAIRLRHDADAGWLAGVGVLVVAHGLDIEAVTNRAARRLHEAGWRAGDSPERAADLLDVWAATPEAAIGKPPSVG